MATTPTSFADRSQRLGLRILSKAGGMPVMADPKVRGRVEKILNRGAHNGFKAQVAVGRAFKQVSGNGAATRADAPKRRGVYDLTPTEDQQMLQQAASELADEVIRPAGPKADADRAVPEEVASAMQEMGLALVGVPEPLGGIAEERSAVAGALVIEQLARGDMGIAVAQMATAAVATALALYGDADQQATYLPHFTGDEPVAAAALALQEPQPLFDPFDLTTTAVAQGDSLVLNGTKALVANAEKAELFVVSAMVGGEARLVVVEAGTDGVTIEDDPAMGVRAARTGRVVLTDVTVPRANLLGSADDHRDAVRRARVAWAAAACGTGRAVLDQVIEYAKERKAFGEPIGQRQAVAFMISDIAIELEGLRLTTLRAAALLDAGKDASQVAAEARSLTATHAAQIGSHAVQLLGGHGFVKEFDNERWYRDLRGAGVLEGTLLV
ncbi:alkylation response protein AidB-like acyl-CoA dehydrogenase [Knoellia remsis]|uniref:Alkylation response protein AidB-like acyl-CoA dehydrogenase n=1 Tax=Knoellia remsis TaxID=407159 RepID=A0A2T0U684_9MICO|nr:acyl-CoA dehydrogenase family protein [Knoellia remsis]PRY53420.1 alkylation response protein AidB-like acyl-CoA dehydrogenase [Knoellia remsis]